MCDGVKLTGYRHVFDEKTKEWVSQLPNSTITPE